MHRDILRPAVMAAILGATLWACADSSGPLSSSPEEAVRPTVTLNGIDLLSVPSGRALGPAGIVSMDVKGSSGGSITVGDATLDVPAGAVDRATTITMSASGSGVDAYTFGPDGLEFRRAATLTVRIDAERLRAAGIDPDELAVAGASNAADDWAVLGGTYDASSGTVTATIPHFSRYALCVR